MDPVLGFLAVEQAFDVKVWAPCVLINGRTNSFSFTGDDHVGIDGYREKRSQGYFFHNLNVCFHKEGKSIKWLDTLDLRSRLNVM